MKGNFAAVEKRNFIERLSFMLFCRYSKIGNYKHVGNKVI